MPTEPKYWFPAKRYGWGWGPPQVWQGWVVLIFFGVFLAVGGAILLPQRHAAFLLYSLCLCALLMVICWLKGEPPRWRWGGDK
ncbi:hypothetical protein [Dyella silvatica]|uniref:hypothetical protein n=1 Tax=Dyella silvatica TaxID=2992128 RepID=UPI00224DA275|nr:hypothetical protein [Dyella silvatica]